MMFEKMHENQSTESNQTKPTRLIWFSSIFFKTLKRKSNDNDRDIISSDIFWPKIDSN